jgi:hypothetical protein
MLSSSRLVLFRVFIILIRPVSLSFFLEKFRALCAWTALRTVNYLYLLYSGFCRCSSITIFFLSAVDRQALIFLTLGTLCTDVCIQYCICLICRRSVPLVAGFFVVSGVCFFFSQSMRLDLFLFLDTGINGSLISDTLVAAMFSSVIFVGIPRSVRAS